MMLALADFETPGRNRAAQENSRRQHNGGRVGVERQRADGGIAVRRRCGVQRARWARG